VLANKCWTAVLQDLDAPHSQLEMTCTDIVNVKPTIRLFVVYRHLIIIENNDHCTTKLLITIENDDHNQCRLLTDVIKTTKTYNWHKDDFNAIGRCLDYRPHRLACISLLYSIIGRYLDCIDWHAMMNNPMIN